MQGLLRLGILSFFTAFTAGCFAQPGELIPIDTFALKRVTEILIEGNKITHERIITRECMIMREDVLEWESLLILMDQTQKNLMNTGLFNYVEVKPILLDSYDMILHIEVQERWYTFPYPIFEIAETNFNTWWETKDFSRTNYGVSLTRKNFRGRNERLTFTARFGYTKKFALRYFVPNINRQQTLGLDISFNYFENAEIVYNTADNLRLFFSDNQNLAREILEMKVGIVYRKGIYTRHGFELKHIGSIVRDSVVALNVDYFSTQTTREQYPAIAYSVSVEKRDYIPYPLQGYQFFGFIEQAGLGFLNFSSLNVTTVAAGWRHYIPLSRKLFLGYSVRGKYTITQNLPYFNVRGLGYGDFVRGYEYYVIDGNNYAIWKSFAKVKLLGIERIRMPLVPGEMFKKAFMNIYGNVNFDLGYVNGGPFAQNNSLAGVPLRGMGVGLDMNTYYDIVMRIEYTINHLGEGGIFLHFIQAL